MLIAVALAIVASTTVGVWAERRYGRRASGASRRSLTLVLYGLLPPVTFFNLARADFSVEVGVGVLCGYVALALAVTLAWFVSARVLRLSRPQTGAVMCCVLVANTGYLGYAVVAGVLGLDQLSEAVVYDIAVAAPALLIGAFSIGAAFGDDAGEGGRARVRAFFARNPPLYAAALALVAPDALAPDALVDISRVAVVAILPIGFFAVGTALAEEAEAGAIPIPPPLDRAIATAVGIRLVVAPLLLLGLAAPLIELPDQYLLLAAMPCGINSLIVTHAYGLDLRTTAAAVAWSTAFALAGIVALAGLA